MPAIESYNLMEKAVLWPMLGYDGFGQPAVGSPVEINVIWTFARTQVQDKDGNTITLDAQAVVDRDIPIGSHLWAGTLVNWLGTGSGVTVSDEELMVVKTSNTKKDIKGRATRRTVGLMRLHNNGAD